MTDEVTRWYRFADLLPEPAATEVRDLWATGEQEAGLDRLVAGLQAHGVVVSEAVVAEIAVVAREWGMGEVLTPRLLHCAAVRAGAEEPALRLIEHPDARPLPAQGTGQAVVPWIGCGRCGEVLARVHTVEPWGALSLTPLHYALLTPGAAARSRLFAADSAWPALAALGTCA
ncbi:hypothetical protein AB0A69_05280 [Streptomyces sp. NPDC045431]|uniref:hypothetical protein n=1 Tax=Streptomyces sp. NPDC045431 TaxID=3155613 RepID=UPI0033DA6048